MSKLVNDKPAFSAAVKNRKDLGAWRQTSGARKDMASLKSYSVKRVGGEVRFSKEAVAHDLAMRKESHTRPDLCQPSGTIC